MDFTLKLFSDEKSHVLINPHWSLQKQEFVREAVLAKTPANHVWLASSGTENFRPGYTKMVGLSKDALLTAAQSVSATFQIHARDVYYNALPIYHVGGLSTLARSVVSGCMYIPCGEGRKWNAEEMRDEWARGRVSLTSLVPTQVFDIVTQRLQAPLSMRLVFVGGGALSPELRKQAEDLGWRLVPTYGLTEACAMIGHESNGEGYTLFPHIDECRTTEGGHLQIRSRSLLTGYIYVSSDDASPVEDPKQEGWFTSGDRAKVHGRTLYLAGRESEFIKIKGESVSLLELTISLENFCLQNGSGKRFIILPVVDARDGYTLHLISEGGFPGEWLERFQQSQLPVVRFKSIKIVEKIPLTAVGKVDIPAARSLLST